MKGLISGAWGIWSPDDGSLAAYYDYKEAQENEKK